MEDNQEQQTEELTDADLLRASRLTRNLKEAAKRLEEEQVRYLVYVYYALQKSRIGAAAQVRSLEEKQQPNDLITWTYQMYKMLETDMVSALHSYAESTIPGQWALSLMGIGPVLAAGLPAHIDITLSPTAAALWRYAGRDPSIEWLGKEKSAAVVNSILGPGKQKDIVDDEHLVLIAQQTNRPAKTLYRTAKDEDGDITRGSLIKALSLQPWNPRLKTLTWKIAQSFVKTCNRKESYYGPLYRERKLYEMEKNAKKDFAEQAEKKLQTVNIGQETEAYKWYSQGMLPPAHIQARAERWAVKLFLSHYWAVAYEAHYNRLPVRPYALAHLDHEKEYPIPNWPMEK